MAQTLQALTRQAQDLQTACSHSVKQGFDLTRATEMTVEHNSWKGAQLLLALGVWPWAHGPRARVVEVAAQVGGELGSGVKSCPCPNSRSWTLAKGLVARPQFGSGTLPAGSRDAAAALGAPGRAFRSLKKPPGAVGHAAQAQQGPRGGQERPRAGLGTSGPCGASAIAGGGRTLHALRGTLDTPPGRASGWAEAPPARTHQAVAKGPRRSMLRAQGLCHATPRAAAAHRRSGSCTDAPKAAS